MSLLEGIEAAVGEGVEVRHVSGTSLATGERYFVQELEMVADDRSGFAEAVEAARGADVVVFAMGEESFQTGEGRSQVDIGLKGSQVHLLREVLAVSSKVVGSTTRPVLELKGFKKIELAAGEAREVPFTLGSEDLAFYTARGVWEAEPGTFEVSVGTSSVERGTARFELH